MSTTPQCHPINLMLANMDRVDVLKTEFYRTRIFMRGKGNALTPELRKPMSAGTRQSPNSRKESKNYQLPFLLLCLPTLLYFVKKLT